MLDSEVDGNWDEIAVPAEGSARAPVAFGGVLSAATLLAAYWRGFYPLPTEDAMVAEYNQAKYGSEVARGEILLFGSGSGGLGPYAISWWQENPRPILTFDDLYISKYMRRRLRNKLPWRSTANSAFESVLMACSEARTRSWITDDLQDAARVLHAEGWAHSVEVWEGEQLIGGTFGIAVGGVLSLDSTFNRSPDAGRVAMLEAVKRVDHTRAGSAVDLQWRSPFVNSFRPTLLSCQSHRQLMGATRTPQAVPFESERPTDWLLSTCRR